MGNVKLTDVKADLALSQYRKPKAVATNYTVQPDDAVLVVVTSTADITITIPAKSTFVDGLY